MRDVQGTFSSVHPDPTPPGPPVGLRRQEVRLKRKNPGLPVIALTTLALAWIGPLQATTVQPLTLPEMVQRSTTIVHGTVQEIHTGWEDGRARLYTYVTLSVAEFLKGGGPAQKAIVFRQLGGRDGDQIIYVPGSPRFAPKQEVLLFLTGDDAGGYPQVMGIFQGAFRPVSGAERRVEGVAPGALASITPSRGGGAGPSPPTSPLEGSFNDFLQRIRDLVKEQGAGSGR